MNPEFTTDEAQRFAEWLDVEGDRYIANAKKHNDEDSRDFGLTYKHIAATVREQFAGDKKAGSNK